MADEVTEQLEAPKFDPKSFIAARNGGIAPEPAKPTEKPAKAAETAKPEESEEDGKSGLSRIPRSIRRHYEQLGRAKAEADFYKHLAEKGMGQPAVEAKPPEAPDPEPQRHSFENESAYLRALGKWDARQEAAKVEEKVDQKQAQKAQLEELQSHIGEMDEKFIEDVKTIPNFEAIIEKARKLEQERSEDDDDSLVFVPKDHPTLWALISQSDQRARILAYFAENPEQWESMMAATKTPNDQIKRFHRLEGRVETMYTSSDTSVTKAAQASEPEKAKKDRETPENPAKGRQMTAMERDLAKPKPTSVVSAKGGSAPASDPVPGSPAWMQARNQQQYGR